MQNPQDIQTDEDEFDFGSLVKEAMALRQDAQTLKDSRKALKEKKPMAGAAYTNMLQDIRRIELQQEWLPMAAVALFRVQHCTCCDNYTAVFEGIFQRQKHRSLRATDRWVSATVAENRGLPKQVKTAEVDVPMCHFCLAEAGYPDDQLGIIFGEDGEEQEVEDLTEEEIDTDIDTDEVDADDAPSPEEQAQLDFEASQDEIAESLQPTTKETFGYV
jgi:hypothetical protein